MSIILKKKFKEGEVVDVADINQVHADLNTDNVDDENTSPGWVTYKHIDPATQINTFHSYENETQALTPYSNTIYQTLNDGVSGACEITTPISLQTDETLRLSAEGVIGTVFTDRDEGEKNYFAFRILINGTTTAGECGYSLTGRSRITQAAGGVMDDIQWRTFQFSHLYIPVVPTTVNTIELQIKLNHGTNVVNIERHSLRAIHVRK